MSRKNKAKVHIVLESKVSKVLINLKWHQAQYKQETTQAHVIK